MASVMMLGLARVAAQPAGAMDVGIKETIYDVLEAGASSAANGPVELETTLTELRVVDEEPQVRSYQGVVQISDDT